MTASSATWQIMSHIRPVRKGSSSQRYWLNFSIAKYYSVLKISQISQVWEIVLPFSAFWLLNWNVLPLNKSLLHFFKFYPPVLFLPIFGGDNFRRNVGGEKSFRGNTRRRDGLREQPQDIIWIHKVSCNYLNKALKFSWKYLNRAFKCFLQLFEWNIKIFLQQFEWHSQLLITSF